MSQGDCADVAVVLPVRFPAPWLADCLDSIARLRDLPSQIVLSIHGDTPHRSEFWSDSENLTVVHSPSNSTLSDVLNAGVLASSAPFVARMDSDDVIQPKRLREQMTFLLRNPDHVLVASHALEIDESGVDIGYRGGPTNTNEILKALRWRNPLIHPSVMFRRSAFDCAGGYKPSAYLAEDYELWLRMAQIGELASIDQPLIKYRVHSEQTSRRGRITRESSRAVLRARRSLATSRRESQVAAWVRHQVWDSYHRIRG